MSAKMREYMKLAERFKLRHPKCAVESCTKRTSDVHHTRGRAGSLLLDWRYWLPVCRADHDWIRDNPELARAKGLICPLGQWNTPDRTPCPPMP